MKKRIALFVSIFTFVMALFLPINGMALQSIGDVADNLMGPTSVVTKLVDITCYIIGMAFILVAFAQYKIHRQSPKLVPLTTPVLLLVLGVCALLIPYVTKVTETGKSTTETKEEKPNLLPMPDIQKGPGVPYPPSQRGDTQQSSGELAPPPPPDSGTAPASSEPPPSGGHWTQDPRYN